MLKVKDCTVYGEYDPMIGQMVVAKILYYEQIKPSELKKIVVDFCADKLVRYKTHAKVLMMTEVEFTERFKKKKG